MRSRLAGNIYPPWQTYYRLACLSVRLYSFALSTLAVVCCGTELTTSKRAQARTHLPHPQTLSDITDATVTVQKLDKLVGLIEGGEAGRSAEER
eukprot:g2220.t1